MAIVRFGDRPFFRNPWADFEKMRRELDNLFQSFPHEVVGRMGPSVFPALNVSEDASAIYVRAEIPGVPASELDIASGDLDGTVDGGEHFSNSTFTSARGAQKN